MPFSSGPSNIRMKVTIFNRRFQIKSHFTRLNFEHAHLFVACLSDHSDEGVQTSKEVTLGRYIINSRNFIGSNLVLCFTSVLSQSMVKLTREMFHGTLKHRDISKM